MFSSTTAMLFWLTISGSIHLTTTCLEHELKNALFERYDKEVRPVRNQSTVTVVKVHTEIYSILAINEQDEKIQFIYWTALTWQDEYLQWNATDYDNCNEINVLANKVWQPDYIIWNMLESVPIVSPDILYVTIESSGIVHLWHSHHLTLKCEMHIDDFPFDIQTCQINGSMWMYDAKYINIEMAEKNIDLRFVALGSPEFETISFGGEEVDYFDNTDNVSYSQVVYSLQLKRRPQYYIFVLFVPSFLLTSLCIIGIFTPNAHSGDREEKMTLGLTTLLSMAVILNISADAMPKTEGLPKLGYFVLYEIAMCCLAIMLSTTIIFIHERAATQNWQPPAFIRWIATSKTPGDSVKSETISIKMESDSIHFQEESSPKGIQRTPSVVNRPGMIASLNSTISGRDLIAYIERIALAIDEYLNMQKNMAESNRIWSLACDRVDMLLLVLLMIGNCGLTYYALT